ATTRHESERPAFQQAAVGRRIARLGLAHAPARGHDHAVVEERVRDLDRAVDDAARVAAEVAHEALERTRAGKTAPPLAQLRAGLLLELAHAHVGVARLQHAALH